MAPTVRALHDRPHWFFCSYCRHNRHEECERECPVCGKPCLCPFNDERRRIAS